MPSGNSWQRGPGVLPRAVTYNADELANGRAEAWRSANKAIAIAPNLPVAHGALAEIYRNQFQLGPASHEYKRTLALAPSSPDALRSYAGFLVRIGDPDEALRLADQALALDPLNSASYGARAAVKELSAPLVNESHDSIKPSAPAQAAHRVAGTYEVTRMSRVYAAPSERSQSLGDIEAVPRPGEDVQAFLLHIRDEDAV